MCPMIYWLVFFHMTMFRIGFLAVGEGAEFKLIDR